MEHTLPVSRTVDLGGPVHTLDYTGLLARDATPQEGAPPLVCVHGLGGSHANWYDLAPLLARTHRVHALDLAGFGRTPRAGRSASVRGNRELLDRFLDEVVGEPAVLVGNSMGASIGLLEAAEAPEKVAGLVLIGPALPRMRADRPNPALARQVALCAVPGLAPRVLARRKEKLGAEAWIDQTLALTTADATRVSPGMRSLAVELVGAAASDGDAAYLEAARSLGLLVARAAGYRAVIAGLDVPGLVIQGALDRLVPPAGVRQLAALQPGWPVHLLEGVGHVPQIEVPEQTAQLVLDWLGELDTGDGLGRPGRMAPERMAGAS